MRIHELLKTRTFLEIKEVSKPFDVLKFIELHESLLNKTQVLVEMDQSEINQLDIWHKALTVPPSVGLSVIPVFIMYVHDGKVLLTKYHTAKITKIINEGPGLDVCFFDDGHRLIIHRQSAISYSKLFLFDDETKLNKFLMLIELKFEVKLGVT